MRVVLQKSKGSLNHWAGRSESRHFTIVGRCDMEQKEKDDLVFILKEAQEIVEDGIGAIGSSMVKDEMVVNLAGVLLHRYWSEKMKPDLGLPFPFDLGPPKSSKTDPASETAFRLLSEIKFCGDKAQDPKWVWRSYLYFLKQARKEQAKRNERVSSDSHNDG